MLLGHAPDFEQRGHGNRAEQIGLQRSGSGKGSLEPAITIQYFFPVFLVTHTVCHSVTPANTHCGFTISDFYHFLEMYFLYLQIKSKHSARLCIKGRRRYQQKNIYGNKLRLSGG